jgi:hypothetical protein
MHVKYKILEYIALFVFIGLLQNKFPDNTWWSSWDFYTIIIASIIYNGVCNLQNKVKTNKTLENTKLGSKSEKFSQ